MLPGLANRLGQLNTFQHRNSEKLFGKIVSHEDIKKILKNAVTSKKPVHILLVGPPGSAKTMFLLDTRRYYKETLFVVGSNTTKSGLLNRLFEARPRLVLVDELEKMNRNDQNSLLHLMETGIISETKVNKTRQMELISWVFGSANSCEKISEPLLSRFIVLKIPEYTFEEFKEIAIFRLKEEDIDEKSALTIAQKVWYELGSRDVRDIIKISRLVHNLQEIDFIVEAMK